MIVSYHPLFEADRNIICAGRQPNAEDLAAIQSAKAVILGQGCYQSLYEMARANCPNVFPNYDARFRYPGKLGQIRLFRKLDVRHPESRIYSDVASFQKRHGCDRVMSPRQFPFVVKLDWGGEGETVYFINSADSLQRILKLITDFEKSGQTGFLLQQYIPSDGKSLRVAAIGRRLISYWRVQPDTHNFYSSLRAGAFIAPDKQPLLQQKAEAVVQTVCQRAGINLAGFDVIFSKDAEDPAPLLLEINYFFGRKGLGGSDAYYGILKTEIQAWLDGIG